MPTSALLMGFPLFKFHLKYFIRQHIEFGPPTVADASMQQQELRDLFPFVGVGSTGIEAAFIPVGSQGTGNEFRKVRLSEMHCIGVSTKQSKGQFSRTTN